MAVTSGSCYSSYARNTRFRIDWERTGTWNDNSGCGSIIRWKLMLENGNKWYSNAIRCNAIYINGVKVHDGNTWSNYTSTGTYELIGWQSNVRIAHNNAGNEKTFNINYTGWFYSSYNVSASTDFTLPSIPRGTSITSFTASKRNETSLTLTWKTADAIAEVYYSTNNGTNWTKDSATNVSSGTITASGLSPNTTYQCKLKVVRNTIETFSSQVSQTTYKIPTQALSSKTETSITMTWSIDSNASKIRYSSDDGIHWSNWTNVSGTSGSYTISNLLANTRYHVITEVMRSATSTSYPTYESAQMTYNYPYVVSTSDFTIGTENTIRMSFYNPLYRTLNIYVIGADNSVINTATRSVNGSTQISNLPEEVTAQYQSIPNSQSGQYKVRLVCSALSRDTTVNGSTYSIVGTEVPTFTNFAYKDTTNNALTQAIDNDQVIVQGVSNVNLVISSANKMVANYSSNPSKYSATFSNLSKTNITYSSSDIDTNLGVPTGSGNQTFKVTAYDSRNLGKEVSKTVNIIPYFKPLINISLTRLNGFETETHLKLSGTFAPVKVNNTDKNAIQQVQYRYKEVGGSWSSWTAMTISSQGNGSYQTTEITLSCDNSKQFNFEFQVTDKVNTTSSSKTLDVGEPLMFLHTSGDLDVNGNVLVGSVKTKNLLNTNIFIQGRINTSGDIIDAGDTNIGEIVRSQGYVSYTTKIAWRGICTNYIQVNAGIHTLSGIANGQQWFYIDYYNTSKTFVSRLLEQGHSAEFKDSVTIPNNGYIRISMQGATVNNYSVSNFKFEEGSSALGYTPFQDVNGSIVSFGNNANGYYIKYSDGNMLCYGKKSFTNVAMTSQWGSLYETSSKLSFGDFPTAFKYAPTMSVFCTAGGTCFVEVLMPTTTSLGTTWLARPQYSTGINVTFAYIAWGRWF